MPTPDASEFRDQDNDAGDSCLIRHGDTSIRQSSDPSIRKTAKGCSLLPQTCKLCIDPVTAPLLGLTVALGTALSPTTISIGAGYE
ncbi:hypothetical protein HN51_024727 [Arachis hypogaea]